MSQLVFNQIDPTIVGGTELAGILDNFKNAVMSGFSGPVRPTQTTAGGYWIDTSVTNRLIFKLYTGTTDVTVFTVNTVSNSVIIQGSDDFFEVTKISEDAVAPYVSFLKKRTSGNGQVKTGDVVGEFDFRAGSDTAGVNYLIGRMRYITLNDITGGAQGGYFVIEGVRKDTAALTEFARFYNGRLAIGVEDPQASIHVRSLTTGLKVERVNDDAIGAKTISRKSRISGGGQVLNNDEISSDDKNSTDSAGTEFAAMRVSVTATEAHTPAARGVKTSVQTIDKGSAVLTEKLNFSEKGMEMQVPTILDGLEKKVQTFASVPEVLALDAQKTFIEVTGNTAMTLKGILATSKSKSFVIYNGMVDKNITVANKAVDAAAGNQIAVNGESSLTIQPGKSVEFVKRTTVNFWSPLVEGNTGITYNEATDLLAKLAARSWAEEPMLSAESKVAPYPSAVGATGLGVTAVSSNTGGVTLLAKFLADGVWGMSAALSGANWQASLPGEDFHKVLSTQQGAGIDSIAIRKSGTKRAAVYKASIRTGSIGGNAWWTPTIVAWDPVDWDSSAATLHSMALTDVATDGTKYVAVASSGPQRIARTSTTLIGAALIWSYISPVTIDVPLLSVAFGNGVWVAVGGTVGASPNHSAWVSPDAVTWTSYAMPNEATVAYSIVRFCGSQFVAVGDTPANGMKILTSPDGQTWTTRYTAPVGTTIKDVAHGGSFTIAVTDAEKIIYSVDGINFQVTNGPSMRSAVYVPNRNFFGVPNVGHASVLQSTISPNF